MMHRPAKRARTYTPPGLELLTEDVFQHNLTPFLSNQSLAKLWACSRHIRSVTLRSLVPRIMWPSSAVLSWATDSEKLDHVHKMISNGEQMHSLPASLTQLIFVDEFDQALVKDLLPKRLSKLTFGHQFNQQLARGLLPSSLTDLSFGCYLSQVLITKV